MLNLTVHTEPFMVNGERFAGAHWYYKPDATQGDLVVPGGAWSYASGRKEAERRVKAAGPLRKYDRRHAGGALPEVVREREGL